MPVSKHNVTAADRNAATEPLSPLEIATRVNQPWCMDGPTYPITASISPVCKRIGAVKSETFGKWLKPGSVVAKKKAKK